jgi:membrane complex biogenesis BtpA family protein
MAVCVREVVRGARLPVGVNLLRNDAAGALAVAHAAGARFVRVNVHTGVMAADQGLLLGRAHETLRLRARLGAAVAIFADVWVKHAAPFPGAELEQAAEDTFHRGLADALIVSGSGTGKPTDLSRVEAVKRAVPEAPVLIGSGVTVESVAAALAVADGAIVGSALEQEGRAGAAVDPARAAALVAALRGGRS